MGQAAPSEITNSDVISMTKAGIGEQTIVLVIQRGPVRFDTSPQALIALKQAGVSDQVLNTILSAKRDTNPDAKSSVTFRSSEISGRTEQIAFERAIALVDPIAKAASLETFLQVYPQSVAKPAVLEMLADIKRQITMNSVPPQTPNPIANQSTSPNPHPSASEPAVITVANQTQGKCSRSISFAVAEYGQVSPRIPDFTQKWIQKNQKRYPGLCFSQAPNSSAINYLLVFSTSQSFFNGIYPSVRISTQTSTAPVNGTGTVTDNSGGFWSYTYNGTVTSTTTTTTHENLPYADTTRGMYINAYSQQGTLVASGARHVTTRQGGDTYNTAGYNLGAALAAINIKERLLKQVVDAITK